MNEIKELINKLNMWLDKTFSPQGKKVFVAVAALLVVGVVYFSFTFSQNQQANKAVSDSDFSEDTLEHKHKERKEDDFDDIEITGEETFVNLTVEDTGRANPFLPSNEAYQQSLSSSYNGYSLMPPPDSIEGDKNASEVVKTKVSGILYDKVKPSAILTISGSDYLVRPGDRINGYKILAITDSLVTVQLGKNVYKAQVGEIVNQAPANRNDVYDLKHRFGGAQK